MDENLASMTDEELTSYMNNMLTDPNADANYGEQEEVSVDTIENEGVEQEVDVQQEENEQEENEGYIDSEQSEDTNDDEGIEDSDLDNDETTKTDGTEDEAEADPEADDTENEPNDGEEEDTDDEDDGQPTDDNTEEKDEVSEPETYNVKANGTDYDLSLDELLQLAPKAFNYTQKMQEIKPYREMISAIKEEGLSKDDINLAIDILKGDKDAITSIIKKNNIDMLEIDTDADLDFTPKKYGKSEQELAIEEVDSLIKQDPEYKITQHVIGTQWDDASREILRNNPQGISVLHGEIKSGVFDTISASAMKMKALDTGVGKSDIEYYIAAGDKYYAAKDAETALIKEADQARAKREAEAKVIADAKAVRDSQAKKRTQAKKRKAATPSKKGVANKPDVIDYLDKATTDEDFSKMMDKLLG